MLIKGIKKASFILFLLFILNYIAKSDDILDEKYYFQLYPSENKEKPYLFHAYTPNSRLITINSTENENCSITENRTVNEYPIKDLSSVILFKGTLLIKTCFGPNKIVEITDEKNETFEKKNNYLGGGLNNIKFCYSTTVYNPYNSLDNENIIITYWTEFEIKSGKEKYKHKCILFDPKTKKFGNEIDLRTAFLGDLFFNDNFYPQSCITFRFTDIYCSIYLDSDNAYINSFFIDTSKIGTSDAHIHLVASNTDYGKNVYQNPISLEKTIEEENEGFGDAFLTEYHNKDKKKIILVSSLFFRTPQLSFIAVTETFKKYYGINIEDSYISPHLFNHFIPNEEDLIVIYTLKTEGKSNLILSRLNLTSSTKFATFKEYSLSNYLREDICDNPKYIQSIFVNSFINYKDKDKQIIIKEGSNNYYKYQRDIVTLLACEKNNNVFYESKKIIMPQCLNILDEINGKDKHIIKYKKNQKNITLDIYNDPNLLSLRNITIEFLPAKKTDQSIIIMVKTQNTGFQIINLSKKNSFVNPTYISIIKNSETFFQSFIIPYRLKQTSISDQTITCHLASDICKFEINNDINIETTINTINTDTTSSEINIDTTSSEVSSYTTSSEVSSYTTQDSSDIYIKTTEIINIDPCFQSKDDICLENKTIWFELDIYKYYVAKIGDCVYIFYENSLFFYSNYDDCKFSNICDYSYISQCLNNSFLPNYQNYKLFLKASKEYNPNEETITIYKNISNYYFHLIHNQKNKSISSIKINENCEKILKNNKIDKNNNFLFFKVDIKREETISRQVEYQIYNPDPKKIYEPLDLTKCYIDLEKRRLEESNDKFKEVSIYTPVDWNETHIKYISELYDNGIFLFDSDHEFYNNICFPYKTPNKGDIYLQERRKKYYINEPLCEDKCTLVDYEKDGGRIVCNCELKPKPQATKNVSFTKKELNKIFNNTITVPNLRVIKCALETFTGNNYGLFISLILLLIFVLSYLYRCYFFKRKKYNKPFKDLRDQIKGQQEELDNEKKQLKDKPDEDIEEEEELEHRYIPKKGKEEPEDNQLIDDEVKPPLIEEKESKTNKKKRDIKNKKINTNKENKKNKIIDSLSSGKQLISEKEDENDEDEKHLSKTKNNPKNKEKETDDNIENNEQKDMIDFNLIDESEERIEKEGNDTKKNDTKISIITLSNNKKNKKKKENENKLNKINEENNEEQNEINDGEEEDKKSKNKEEQNEKNEENEEPKVQTLSSLMKKNSKGPKNFKTKPKKKETNLIDENIDKISNNIEKDNPNKNKNDDTISENVIVNNINPGVYDRDKDDLSSKLSRNDNFIFDNTQLNITLNKENNENENDSQKNKNINDSHNNKDKKNNEDKKNNDLIDEEEGIENLDLEDPNDPDLEYPNDEEEEKKENDKKNNFMSNVNKTPKKKKKKKKKKKSPANPPKKKKSNLIEVKDDKSSDSNISDKKSSKGSKSKHTSFISDKKEDLISNNDNDNDIQGKSSGRISFKINKKEKSKIINKLDGYLLDIMNYDDASKKDKRGLFLTLISLIKNNSTLLFVISCDKNDLFTKVSVLILALSFYIFINILFMFNTSLLHLYIGKDPDFENSRPIYVVMNLLVPFLLLYIPIMLLKKITSIREFIYEQIYEFGIVVDAYENKKINPAQTQLRLHDIETQISKFKNLMDYWEKKVFWGGFIFLLFNFFLTTSFCGIYKNSFGCLITNTLVSIAFTISISFIFFLISTILRRYGLSNKGIMAFYISALLNPTYLLYGKAMVTRDRDRDDDDIDEERSNL